MYSKSNYKNSLLRGGLILLLVSLSGFYLWVLSLAACPDVSFSYQTYYLQKKTLYWGGNDDRFELPKEEMLDTRERLSALSRKGWGSATEQGRPLESAGGLYFSLPKGDGRQRMVFELARGQSGNTPLPIVTLDGRPQTAVTQNDRLVVELDVSGADTPLHYLELTPDTPLLVKSIGLQSDALQKTGLENNSLESNNLEKNSLENISRVNSSQERKSGVQS